MDVVKYNNDFNLLPMPKLKALQMDIFMAILSLIKDKRENTPFLQKFFNPDLREIKMSQKTFIDLCRLQDEYMSYPKIFNLINDTLTKLLHTIIDYQKDEKTLYKFVCFEFAAIEASEVRIRLSKDFYHMIINYKMGYTAFELAEFTELSSKYTKTLYRLLKQYRKTGILKMQWDEFTRILDIPEKLKICDIDKGILKPAIKELSKEINLFDQARTPFKNLTYEKIKEKGTRGRGGKVVGIIFNFEPEKTKQEQSETEALKQENEQLKQDKEKLYKSLATMNKVNYLNEKYIKENLGMGDKYAEYIQQRFVVEFDNGKNKQICKILSISENIDGKSLKANCINQETNKRFILDFKDEKHLQDYLKKYRY